MATEFEHKLRVTGDGWREAVTESHTIGQSYLCATPEVSVRVRLVDDDTAFLTVKGRRSGIGRPEYEYEIPVADARELLRLAPDRFPIEKTRHRLGEPWAGWDVDEFGGANDGLVVAELEVEDPDAAWEPPPWTGEDLTADDRYSNAALFSRPYGRWSQPAG
jgi:adenylate cyclase